MKANHVKINDIYDSSQMIHDEFGIDTNNVHFNHQGYKELAIQISDYLKHEIKQLNN